MNQSNSNSKRPAADDNAFLMKSYDKEFKKSRIFLLELKNEVENLDVSSTDFRDQEFDGETLKKSAEAIIDTVSHDTSLVSLIVSFQYLLIYAN